MADFRFGPKTDRDREQVVYRTYICQISRFLDAHEIPNVLWGELVMNMLLIPLVIDGICIVIPDEHIDKARDLLLAAGCPPCQVGSHCPFYHPYASRAIPYAHFNLVDCGPLDFYKPEIFGENPREWYTLELFKKSDVLWGAPEIPLSPPTPSDPDYWTVTDDRLPEVAIEYQLGRIVDADYPVKIPSPARFAESLTLLYFRDNFPEETARGNHWDSLLVDMKVVLKKHCLFELEDLPEKNASHVGEKFAAAMRKAGEVPERSPWPSAVLGLPGWREELKRWEEEGEEEVKEEQTA
ncbi:hypothetical protein CNMCM5623_006858 [Aspergillus felis]|uniref:Uncharacterized protein n=1 Tax=Aspergillus felis TaxID=1287682 RepID=A0A8H6QK65_9EURO|nr:hypothetical protein CNMCM5623_006858 [Aspergillus felis]KAF7184743.1 hypothetical protein CNMCM7691_006166 [Aspergillus felis]